MTARKLYFLLLGAAILSIAALFAAAYGANFVLESQSKRLTKAHLNSLVLEEKQRQLTKARADIKKYQSLAAIAKNIVPQDKDQAQTVREIVSIAQANDIKLGNVTFPSSSLGNAGAAGGKQKFSQLTAVQDIAGVYILDITVQSDSTAPAPYANLIDFLDALEHNRRTALVNGVTLQPSVNDPGKLSFTLNLQEYIKP